MCHDVDHFIRHQCDQRDRLGPGVWYKQNGNNKYFFFFSSFISLSFLSECRQDFDRAQNTANTIVHVRAAVWYGVLSCMRATSHIIGWF